MSADNDSAHDAEPVRDNPVAALVVRARGGDERAWAALVERYAPLIWSLCRRYRLDTTDTADVGQNVWPPLAHQLGKIRVRPRSRAGRHHNPVGMPTRPGQSAGAARCTARAGRRHHPGRPGRNDRAGPAGGRATRGVREAFTHLSPRDQQLIALLIEDPPAPYAQISARLGIPVGSIGPNRRRCLEKLRHHRAIAKLISAETQTA